ncbi:hypothetical protein EOM09_04695 [bacterium]|nr:hypothetical protein [bacterium]
MRNDLLQQRAKEIKEENNINEEIIISSIFENKVEDTQKEEIEKVVLDNTSKNIQEKQRKLLEKISYEANVCKKE